MDRVKNINVADINGYCAVLDEISGVDMRVICRGLTPTLSISVSVTVTVGYKDISFGPTFSVNANEISGEFLKEHTPGDEILKEYKFSLAYTCFEHILTAKEISSGFVEKIVKRLIIGK